MTDISEAQTYEQVGTESPELHAATQHPKGWDTSVPEAPILQAEGHDISFWNKRGNRQAIGKTRDDRNYAADFYGDGDSDGITSTAGDFPFGGPASTAAAIPRPYTGYSEDGIIDGATAAKDSPASPPYP